MNNVFMVVADFYDGNLTVDETAAELQARVSAVLNCLK